MEILPKDLGAVDAGLRLNGLGVRVRVWVRVRGACGCLCGCACGCTLQRIYRLYIQTIFSISNYPSINFLGQQT